MYRDPLAGPIVLYNVSLHCIDLHRNAKYRFMVMYIIVVHTNAKIRVVKCCIPSISWNCETQNICIEKYSTSVQLLCCDIPSVAVVKYPSKSKVIFTV